MSKLTDWVSSSAKRERLFAQEQLIVDVAEEIASAMEKTQNSKVELAATLGKSKAFVSQLLSGSRNMTLRTLADIAFSLGKQPCIRLLDAHESDAWNSVDAVLVSRQPAAFAEVEVSNQPKWGRIIELPQQKVA